MNKIVQLSDFLVSSQAVEFNYTDLDNVMPGKYIVFLNHSDENNLADLYIIHESVALEPMDNYNWERGISFNTQGSPMFILDSLCKSMADLEDMEAMWAEKIVDVINNVVGFTMPHANYRYALHLLMQGAQIVGFNINGIGQFINTPNCQLTKACISGNFDDVKKLLTNPDITQRATLDSEHFYQACAMGHREIILFLLMSSDIGEHAKIYDFKDTRDFTAFMVLCHFHPRIVQELIMVLPQEQVLDIKTFLNTQNIHRNNIEKHKKQLLETLKERELREIDKAFF